MTSDKRTAFHGLTWALALDAFGLVAFFLILFYGLPIVELMVRK